MLIHDAKFFTGARMLGNGAMRMGLLGWMSVLGLLAGCDGGQRTAKQTTGAESVQESREGAVTAAPTPQVEEEAGEVAVQPQEAGGTAAPQEETKADEAPAPLRTAIPNMFRGTISRDDDRYPEQLETIDGIVVKLEDTNHTPLEAELSVKVGRYKLKRHHIRVGEPVYGRGASGRSYRIIIERILPKGETVHFMIEAVSPGAAGEWQTP